jgi:hypothetical protein
LESDDRVFVSDLGGGHTVRYNVDSLVLYLVSSGDFSEPTTRRPFTDDELRKLDEAAAGLGLPSAREAKETKSEQYAQARIQRDMLEGLERCLGEVRRLQSSRAFPLDVLNVGHEISGERVEVGRGGLKSTRE